MNCQSPRNDWIHAKLAKFLTGTSAWLGCSALGFGAGAERTKTISIFHTTDLHGHILPTQPTRFLCQGEPVAADCRFKIGVNSYDAQSGGRKLMRLPEIAAHPTAKRVTTRIGTRSALIDRILNRKEIS